MGFSLFGKKGSNADKAVEHMTLISENLKNSFVRVKTDIKVVRDWLSYFKTKDDEYEERFKAIESSVDELSEVLAYLTEKEQEAPQPQIIREKPTREEPYYAIEEKIPSQQQPRSILDDLTETQRAIFLRLAAFQRESGQEWTSLKALAHDIYPDKLYDKVRSTLSEYVGLLIDTGLIKKTRRGKQTYLAVTQKGQQYVGTEDDKKAKKPIAKAK